MSPTQAPESPPTDTEVATSRRRPSHENQENDADRGLKSQHLQEGDDTEVTLLRDPARIEVFTSRPPIKMGARRSSAKTPPRRGVAHKGVTIFGTGTRPGKAFARAVEHSHPSTTPKS